MRGVGWVFWTKAAPAFLLAALLLLVIPLDGTGGAPPIRILLLAGLCVGAVMTGAVWLAIRFDLGLGAQVASYAVAFNLLIVAAKFVLGPYAVYQVNQVVAMSDPLPLSDPLGAVGAGALVLALYALVLWAIYLATSRRLRSRLETPAVRPPGARAARGKRWWPALLIFVLLVGMGGTTLLILGLVVLATGFEYLAFVFSSGVSLVVAVTLALALALAAKAFRAAEHRAVVLGDAAVLTSMFWVCLRFLALYQVLWVVFVLALTSVWPLKVVTPK